MRRHICILLTCRVMAALDFTLQFKASIEDREDSQCGHIPLAAAHAIARLCTATYKRGNARFKGRETPEFVLHCCELYIRQEGMCYLTGVPMTADEPWNRPTHISIDRIDGQRGYEVGNVRLTCAWANHALCQYGDQVFYLFMCNILTKRRYAQPNSTSTPLAAPPENLLDSTTNANVLIHQSDTPYHFLLHLCQTAKVRGTRKRSQLRCPHFRTHCIDLLRHQGMCCAISGLEMTYRSSHTNPYQLAILCWSAEEGYVPGNVLLVCKWVNGAFTDRGTTATHDFLALCQSHLPNWLPT
jgi:hypothetical protein